MSEHVEYGTDWASESQIVEHLRGCDADFSPRLSERVQIEEYAGKIFRKAVRFEAWARGELIGLVAAYFNDASRNTAYITSVSVLPRWTGKGSASVLLSECIRHAADAGFRRIDLEVQRDNEPALMLYRKFGFFERESNGTIVAMRLVVKREKPMAEKRDYNVEIVDTADRKYAYGFDFDVMHPYMIQSFDPFFRKGNLLELGSFKGDFTKRLLDYFTDITCVEASDVALADASEKLGGRVKLINASFQKAVLPTRYDNVVLTHVLEHLDDPVGVLRKINDEWLADTGRLFLVCPNANAPSRQIAVKMGLITHNAAVTPAEAEHGHRATYTLDTLEREAVAAGLRVVYRSGIFFKALANFQWDRLLMTDIISKEYLDGCYKLGQQYPDLCASIFLLCERGKETARA